MDCALSIIFHFYDFSSVSLLLLSSMYCLFRSVLAETAVGCANGGGPTMYGLKRMAAGMAVCL